MIRNPRGARFGSQRRVASGRISNQRGATLIEFALCAFLLVMILLAFVEMGRMLLVYTTVTNAARAGARYAIVHGSTRTGSGVDGPSGPGNDPPEVVQVVSNFASAGAIDESRLNITVTYPNGNDIGDPVNVTVVYPYDPLMGYFPLSVSLRNTTQGVIVF